LFKYLPFRFWIIFSFILIFGVCGKKENLITYQVEKKDYQSIIKAVGSIEAKNTITITGPEIWPPPTVKWIADEGKIVKKNDTICILKSDKIRTEYENTIIEYNQKKFELNKTSTELNIQIQTLESQLQSLEASGKITELQLSKLDYASENEKKIIHLKIEKSRIERERLKNKIAHLKAINQKELKNRKLKLMQMEKQLAKAKETFNKSVVLAPDSGVIIYCVAHSTGEKIKEGDMVFSRMPIIKIPVLDEFQAVFNVPDKKMKLIKKDQKCIFVNSSLNIHTTGFISTVSPVGSKIKRNTEYKEYEIKADMDSLSEKNLINNSIQIEIITHEFQDTVVIPVDLIENKDSVQYVYALQNGKISKIRIEGELFNNDYCLVSSGLKGGEKLLFNKGGIH